MTTERKPEFIDPEAFATPQAGAVSENYLGSWCAQCGPDVKVDEDGCCASCGADAVGDGADQALRLRAENSRLREALKQISKIKCRCGWSGPCGCGDSAIQYADDALSTPEPKGGGK